MHAISHASKANHVPLEIGRRIVLQLLYEDAVGGDLG